MECPHLAKCAKVTEIIPSSNAQGTLQCSVCKSTESVWICITCGQLNCGRYIKAHGLKHYESSSTHPVCLECKELSVFCYACDDFIVNDTPGGHIEKLRSVLSTPSSSSSETSVSSTPVPSTPNAAPPTSNHQDPDRTLRPRRKRSQSVESSGNGNSENRPEIKKVKQNGKQQKKAHLVGLRNLGNTCFMSAVLQSLSNIHEFCRVLKQLPSLDTAKPLPNNTRESRSKPPPDGPIMTEELKKVLVALSQAGEGKKAISPEALFLVIWKVVPRFRGYQQQDAHEFLRYMLDRLHTELLMLLPDDLPFVRKSFSPYSKRLSGMRNATSSSLVTTIFGGTLQSEVTCLACKTSSKKHDPFLDLSIDVPNEFIQNRANRAQNKEDSNEKKKKCRLYDCLQKFVDVEELADSERFFCNNCKHKQRSTKKFWIRRLPNVLCLHIKRFRWSSYSRTKLDTHVDFPLTGLNMSDFLLTNLHDTRCSNAGSCLYDLAAVIVHHGSGAGSGHYTAFVIKNNHWYHFNDSTVLETDQETVAQCKAYILFYIQREFRLPGM